jgi:outer membrane receptor protein involved in Fe transport
MNLKQRKLRTRSRRLGLLATALLPIPAFAAPAPGEGADTSASTGVSDAPTVGEIVVTATRRTELLSRVPASVAAKDQVELDKRGVRSVSDLARLTPSITFGQTSLLYGTGQSAISIRGVDSASGIPTTGVYIDDTPVQTRIGVSPSLSNAYPQVFDLDRVEVLRGPQGTLFGSGSVGGAVRFITPGPSYSDAKLYGRSEVATTKNGGPSYEIGLAGGGPIVEDQVGFRGSVWYRRDGGYVDRLDRFSQQRVQKDINRQDSYSARVAFGWKPTDDITITPSLFIQDLHIADGSRFELATSNRDKQDLNLSLNVIPEKHMDRFYLPAVKATWDLGPMTLISDTSYFTRRTRTQSDDASLSLSVFAGVDGFLPELGYYSPGTASRTSQKAFTQELRLQDNNSSDRLNWIVGLFYQHSSVQDQYAGSDPRLLDEINAGQALQGQPPFDTLTHVFGTELYKGQFSVFQQNRHVDDQKAVYGQADYEILPKLKVIAGLRYTVADYEFTGFTAGPLYTTDGRTDNLKATSRTFTPKVGLSYQADGDNLFYATAAKGIRGPGVSPPVGTTCNDDAAAIGFDPLKSIKVRPDSIWSYEAGSKNRLFGGKVAIDASIYRIDWKNVQTLFALPGCQLYVALNLGNAKIDGADFAVSARPVTGLTLGASVSYIKARYTTSIPGAGGTTIRKAGEPFNVAPWSLELNAEYSRPVGEAEAYVRADYSYSSHNDKPVDVASPLVDPNIPRAPATSLLNLRAGARIKDVDVSLFVNNVTGSQPLLSLYHDTLTSPAYRSGTFRPRTVGVTATIRR